MIRSPVRPMARDGLWQLVCQQSSVFERGLRVVAEDLDLGTGDLGNVDGLLRDAAGRAVLVFVADEHEIALPARVFAAYSFWQRNRESLPRAIPEADLRGPLSCRVLVIGSRLYPELVQALVRLRIETLAAIEVESFQVSGLDRLAIRNVLVAGGPARDPDAAVEELDEFGDVPQALNSSLDEEIDDGSRQIFADLTQVLTRLDPGVQIEGDRFSRRAVFRGGALCEFWYVDGHMSGTVPGRDLTLLREGVDVRAFGDQIMRRYLELLSEERASGSASPRKASAGAPSKTDKRKSARRDALEGLRASVSKQRLSNAEYEALEDVAREDG
ncbi:MAG: hypothetical protein VYE77_04045 [Planctomycetota bacterium]|nr:hypothetical protein [Planctomycetota bacterium]